VGQYAGFAGIFDGSALQQLVALDFASKGSVTTETLRAFTESEYRKIIGALP